jgi:hypothetical protein
MAIVHPSIAGPMSEFNMDPNNPAHVRAYMDEQPWVQTFKAKTGQHPLDLGISDEAAAQQHLATQGGMQLAQASPQRTRPNAQTMIMDDSDAADARATRTGVERQTRQPGRMPPRGAFTNQNVAREPDAPVIDANKSGFFNR